MFAEERQNQIIEEIKINGRVSVISLAEKFNLSKETIRRDLKELEEQGLVVKTHGGAIIKEKNSPLTETPFVFRSTRNINKKNEICALASKAVNNYDQIFLDNSTTVSCLIKFLPQSFKLTIITNSIQNMLEIMKNDSTNWTVIFIGGIFIEHTLSFSGFPAINTLDSFKPNKAFFSCQGLNTELEVTEGNIYDAEVKSKVLKNSYESYLLIDNTKINFPGVVKLANIENYNYLVTTKDADKKTVEKVRKRGVEVLISQ